MDLREGPSMTFSEVFIGQWILEPADLHLETCSSKITRGIPPVLLVNWGGCAFGHETSKQTIKQTNKQSTNQSIKQTNKQTNIHQVTDFSATFACRNEAGESLQRKGWKTCFAFLQSETASKVLSIIFRCGDHFLSISARMSSWVPRYHHPF